MSKNKINTFIMIMVFILIGSFPFLVGSSYNTHNQTSAQAGIPTATFIPEVPRQVTFAGQTIDLTRYDLRERMDRELTAFTYTHSTTSMMIKKANRYFPIVEPILQANGIPDDFKYLMVIESNLNTLARSPAGAAGLWQFMEGTGKEFGLEVNKNIDERYNIEKATRAACKYLKNGYNKYGDWLTVAASYNAGMSRISNALSQQGVEKATDLWLNEETSRYMFRMIAAKMVLENPKQYGFMMKKENLYPAIPYEQVKVKTEIPSLVNYAKQKGITYAQLKDANPWLRGTSLENKSGREYILNIPSKEGMNYDPSRIVPHYKNWVVD